jgi:thioredoxin 1
VDEHQQGHRHAQERQAETDTVHGAPSFTANDTLRSMSVSYLPVENAPSREEIDRTPGLVLLEFGTDWCPLCRATAPHVAALLRDHPAIRHLKVEDGPGRRLGRSFLVKLWPNLVFLKDGVVVRQLARPTAADLREAFAAFTTA